MNLTQREVWEKVILITDMSKETHEEDCKLWEEILKEAENGYNLRRDNIS